MTHGPRHGEELAQTGSGRDTGGATWTRVPSLLTPSEVADLLRTSKGAVYAMVERGQLPGVVRIGRRVLIREADLLEWLRQNTRAIVGKE